MIIQKSFASESGAGHVSGTLYLVATPIGNLEDMTFRAVRILKEVYWIAAEDTRQTRKLLTHFEISARLVSYHEHNKLASGPELIRVLKEGHSIALVSDAGTPAISDPGYELVLSAIQEHIPVVSIPGANAALSGLIVSGLATERFMFIGFLPREIKAINKELEKLQSINASMIFYESPHRVKRTMQQMLEVWGERKVVLVRELTKKHEEIARGMLSECVNHLEEHPPKGEYCIIVEGSSLDMGQGNRTVWWHELSLEEHLQSYVDQGVSRKEAVKKVAQDRNLAKRDVYNQFMLNSE